MSVPSYVKAALSHLLVQTGRNDLTTQISQYMENAEEVHDRLVDRVDELEMELALASSPFYLIKKYWRKFRFGGGQ